MLAPVIGTEVLQFYQFLGKLVVALHFNVHAMFKEPLQAVNDECIYLGFRGQSFMKSVGKSCRQLLTASYSSILK